jgi:hypothetical protein
MTILAAGTITESMIVGKRLPVEILKVVNENPDYWLGAEYSVKYVGDKKVCLDFGQNWYIHPGETTTVHQGNIDRAAEWKAKGY